MLPTVIGLFLSVRFSVFVLALFIRVLSCFPVITYYSPSLEDWHSTTLLWSSNVVLHHNDACNTSFIFYFRTQGLEYPYKYD